MASIIRYHPAPRDRDEDQYDRRQPISFDGPQADIERMRLTPSDTELIQARDMEWLRMRLRGLKLRQIARTYNTSPQNVSYRIRHLPERVKREIKHSYATGRLA